MINTRTCPDFLHIMTEMQVFSLGFGFFIASVYPFLTPNVTHLKIFLGNIQINIVIIKFT